MTRILGVSAHFHDAAACLFEDGRLVCAAEEERFTRRKHDRRIPRHAARFCLDFGGARIDEIDAVAYYERPSLKLERQRWMLAQAVEGAFAGAGPLDAGRPEREIRRALAFDGPIEWVAHHEAHAASAYLFSGFEEAAVLVADGVGEWATTSYGRGCQGRLELFEEVRFPHSLGLFYSTLTSYLGFPVNDGEAKVMGLAPYGTPRFADALRSLIALGPGGQFRLDLHYFDYPRSAERMYSGALVELLGQPPREPGAELTAFHRDVARSLQLVLEEALLHAVRHLHARVPQEDLCLAGGVALNSAANGRLRREGPFARLFVQPAAGDAGGALGAAALAYQRLTGETPAPEALARVDLGPRFDASRIARRLSPLGLPARDYGGRPEALLTAVAERLAEGAVVGFFSGRMEFGPRALGCRSILADPRRPEMRERINALVKRREGFQPFAPAVLAEHAHRHFELDHALPFMTETCRVISDLDLPAVTHVDRSARVQTVEDRPGCRFAGLLRAFHRRTGCPILLNTSFNLRGEPIVCTPEDALRCFAYAPIDVLVLEDLVLERGEMPERWHRLAEAGAPPADASHAIDAAGSVYSLL